MKKIARFTTAAIALAAAALLNGCQPASPAPVGVSISAGLAGSSAKSARALVGGEAIQPITAYRVVFKKIEIGNSESDTFTLWESAEGEVKDVASTVGFSDVQAVYPGTYNYVRLTIGDTLSVDGKVTDAATGTVYSGTGSCLLDAAVFLWGSEIPNASGEITLRSPITIAEGSSLGFDFAVDGTVTYKSGTAQNALLGVTKPTLSLTVE